MERSTLITLIEKQPIFSDDEKKKWINRAKKEGISHEVLWDFELALADSIELFFSDNKLQGSMYPKEIKQLKTQRDTALRALESLRKEVSIIAKDTARDCDTITANALRAHLTTTGR